jgi:hypothetical protein
LATFTEAILNRRVRIPACRCITSIFYHFFFCQHRAALRRKFKIGEQIPVSQVDHQLDILIPFSPGWIVVYLDFVGLWVRMLGFLLSCFGKGALDAMTGFLDTMGKLYRFAGEVYQKNLSTTRRPFYIRRPRFLLIHLVDPHLMCIPSLHVMVVIFTYTSFRRIMKSLDAEGRFSVRVAECFRGALDITEAILYVKQHSVNCVAAAMYAMSCFDGAAFPPEEAESFTARLFTGESPRTAALPRLDPEAAERVREHILGLYRQFYRRASEAGPGTGDWTQPLLEFLRPLRI